MKRFFCLKAKNGLIKIGTNTSAVSSTVSGSKPVVVSTSQTQKKKWSRSYAGHFHFHCVCVDYSNKLFYTMIFFSRSHTISSICYSGRKRALRKTACLPSQSCCEASAVLSWTPIFFELQVDHEKVHALLCFRPVKLCLSSLGHSTAPNP